MQIYISLKKEESNENFILKIQKSLQPLKIVVKINNGFHDASKDIYTLN